MSTARGTLFSLINSYRGANGRAPLEYSTHLQNVAQFGVPAIVAVNRFDADTAAAYAVGLAAGAALVGYDTDLGALALMGLVSGAALGAVAIAGLIGTFIASAVSNTRTLYRLEPLTDDDAACTARPRSTPTSRRRCRNCRAERLANAGDLWADMPGQAASLAGPMQRIERLGGLGGEQFPDPVGQALAGQVRALLARA